MPCKRCILFFLLLAAAVLDTTARESSNFDFGWRWITELHQCTSQEYSGYQCQGLHGANTASVEECRDLCCQDDSCTLYQYDPTSTSRSCWIGSSSSCYANSSWVGGKLSQPIIPYANRSLDDSTWTMVDLPHDPRIIEEYDFNSTATDAGQAFLPFKKYWYRKHFKLPSAYEGQSVWLHFEGAFALSSVYINDELVTTSPCGYLPFLVRLDNLSSISYGGDNLVAVMTDSTRHTGWWYEGAGIYRSVQLVTAAPLHFTLDGPVSSAANVTSAIVSRSSPADGQTADAIVHAKAYIESHEQAAADCSVRFTLTDSTGKQLSGTSASITIAGGGIGELGYDIVVSNAELWSIARPYLYTLRTEVLDSSGATIDVLSTVIGIRSVLWDAATGFYLNEQAVKLRGFCNHNDFAGVGVYVPDRINLFRLQALRSVGGNSWRTSHNPPVTAALDIADRLGVTVMVENRDFAALEEYADNFGLMIRRDRNHAAIHVWSFCNEGGCSAGGAAGVKMLEPVGYANDGSRKILANMNGAVLWNQEMELLLDVQGFSHSNTFQLDDYHAGNPSKPLVHSECCSCQNQRGEDTDFPPSPDVFDSSQVSECIASQTGVSNSPAFDAGTYTWTLFDYYGESGRAPHISSDFGQFDLAGFPKTAAYWYRSWWLSNISASDWGRPPLADHDYVVYIGESWEPVPNHVNRTIFVTSNAPYIEIYVNGQLMGSAHPQFYSADTKFSVLYTAGNITAVGYDTQRKVVGSYTRYTPGTAQTLVVSLDAPNPDWGTGSALVADGEDAALVRVEIVDEYGRIVPSANHNVTFQVLSGPGRLIGVGNGDPACHEPNQAAWRTAYHGLVRAVVRITSLAALSPAARERMVEIDGESSPFTSMTDVDPIVIQASSPGLKSATVSIPVSVDIAADGVLASASQGLEHAYFGTAQ